MKTAMFGFDKFHFLLAIRNLVDNINPPILPDIEIFLHSISISTQPNDLPTTVNKTEPGVRTHGEEFMCTVQISKSMASLQSPLPWKTRPDLKTHKL